MDGFELNKFMGAITGSLMVFLLIGWLASTMYGHHGGHGEEKLYYAVATEEGAGGAQEEPEEVEPLAVTLAAATVEDGASVFKKKCSSCHKADEGAAHATGPALFGVMGRAIASADGYTRYSDVLKEKGVAWDWESMNAFLTKPSAWARGTNMKFAGLKKPEDRAAVMLFLNGKTGAPIALPEAEAVAPAPAE